MKRKRSLGVTVSFLDTLSNAMAAVLIVAIIQMNPSSAGEGASKGFYFITATAKQSRSDLHLEMLVQKDTMMVFSEVAPVGSDYHFDYAPGHIRLLIAKNLPADAVVSVFLREPILEAPDSIAIALSSLLPTGASGSAIEVLTRANHYRIEVPSRLWK